MNSRILIPLAAVVLAVAVWWLSPDRRAFGEQAPAPAAVPAGKWEYGALRTGGVRYEWESGDVRVRDESWKGLAEAMKLPVKGDDVGQGAVLNALGAQGWELVSHAVTAGQTVKSLGYNTYTFKRRVP